MAKKKTTGSPAPADAVTGPASAPSAPRRRRVAAPKSTADVSMSATANDRGAAIPDAGTALPEAGETLPEAIVATSALAAVTSTAPTYEEIAEAAYHRYLKRGGGDGRALEDWIAAEQDLRSR